LPAANRARASATCFVDGTIARSSGWHSCDAPCGGGAQMAPARAAAKFAFSSTTLVPYCDTGMNCSKSPETLPRSTASRSGLRRPGLMLKRDGGQMSAGTRYARSASRPSAAFGSAQGGAATSMMARTLRRMGAHRRPHRSALRESYSVLLRSAARLYIRLGL